MSQIRTPKIVVWIIKAVIMMQLIFLSACLNVVAPAEVDEGDFSTTMDLLILAVNRNQTQITISVAKLNKAGNEIINEGTVGLPNECPVIRLENSQGTNVGCDGLAVGQVITATLGALRESYPWYSEAKKIVINTSGAIESNSPLSTRLNSQFLGVIKDVTKVDAYKTTYPALTIEVIESSKYPEVKIIQPVLGQWMLVWGYRNGQYQVGNSNEFRPGQKVSILLEGNWSSIDSINEIEGVILEAIIFVE